MEYKFRGKRKDNGEWAYGLLVMGVFNDTMIQVYANGFYTTVVVMPETVGMFTGLKDRYNNDIYEDDIVKFVGGTCSILHCGLYADQHYCEGQVLVVQYLKSGFTIRKPELIDKNIENLVGNVGQYQFWNHQRSLMLIGNRTDNPELLNPAQGNGPLNTMQNFDPKEQAEEVKEQATEVEQAPEVTGQAAENAEEVTEG